MIKLRSINISKEQSVAIEQEETMGKDFFSVMGFMAKSGSNLFFSAKKS